MIIPQNTEYEYVMVDLETLGLSSKSPVLSIGAVLFNLTDLDTMESINSADPTRTFYVEIEAEDWLKYGRVADAETIQWWMAQSDSAKAVFNRTSPHKTFAVPALNQFNTFAFGNRPRGLWSNGANYDVVILSDWAKDMKRAGEEVQYDSKFNWEYDVRTLLELAKKLTGFDKKSVPRVGTYHNALDDAKYQVLLVQEACRSLNPNKSAVRYVESVEPGVLPQPPIDTSYLQKIAPNAFPAHTQEQASEALFLDGKRDFISPEDKRKYS